MTPSSFSLFCQIISTLQFATLPTLYNVSLNYTRRLRGENRWLNGEKKHIFIFNSQVNMTPKHISYAHFHLPEKKEEKKDFITKNLMPV